jgi:hypothetical protein
MTEVTPFMVAELVCLHKQVTQRVVCNHCPRHDDLADVVIHAIGTRDLETIRLVRRSTSGRRQPPVSPSEIGG